MERSKRIEWEEFEHSHSEKSSDWFWIVGIVGVAGAVLAIYFDNVLFGLLILLAAFTGIIQGHTKPKLLRYEISRKGIRAGDVLYPFSSLESFWVIDEDVNDRIILRSNSTFLPVVVLPFNSLYTNAEDIRDYLLEYLDEEELHEPIGQKIMETFGF